MGRGIERIITACKHDDFSVPDFRYDASGVWTIFRYEYPNRAINVKTNQKRPESDQKELETSILELIKEQPHISRKEIARRLGLHDKQHQTAVGFASKRGRD